MQSGNLLNINLAHAAKTAELLNIELTDRFFANLEQEEISGGEVHAAILVRASAGDIYTVKTDVKGKVIVPCDRCLDPLSIDVEATDTIKVKDADPEEGDSDEMLYMEAGKQCYDLSWEVYEIIATALPMQRVHAEGQCNKDIVSYIMRDDKTAEEPEEEDV